MIRLYLAGPAGSGKSTVAGLLVERHGFVRVSLGDLPRALAVERGLRPTRSVLQALGDELRQSDPARLARLALAQLTGPAGAGRAVVDGVRLPEEAAVLRPAGFLGVGVRVPPLLRLKRLRQRGECWWSGEAHHRTEVEATRVPVDHWLDGGGDLAALSTEVSVLVAALKTADSLGWSRRNRSVPGGE